MDLNAFRVLGDRIADEYRRADHDELRLSAIAGAVLRDAELPSLDLTAITKFLCETDIVQEPGNRFSDLPVIVYRANDFYVQLLVWNESTTTVHEHAFTGAFRVLEGSSIHSTYTFEEVRRISSRLLVGDVQLDGVELLRKGDVREIAPGHGGLTHALYHLDHPSATIVVRTPRLAWATPQYSIVRPCFAVDEPGLRSDGQVKILRRALHAAKAAGVSVLDLLKTQIELLDFPRLFMLHEELDWAMPDEDDQNAFIAALRERHGDLADRYRDAIEMTRIQNSLLHARDFSTEPDMRLFFALLLNVPERDWFLRIVKETHPDDDPATRCAEWLNKLASPEGKLDALMRKGVLKQATKQRKGFVERLTGALPSAEDERKSVLRELLAGGGGSADTAVATELREMPELARLLG